MRLKSLNDLFKLCGFIVTMSLFILLSSCDNQQTANKNPLKDDLTKAEAKEYLNELASQLVTGGSTSSLSKRSVIFQKLRSSEVVAQLTEENFVRANTVIEDAPETITIDGRVNRINIECINTDKLSNSSLNKSLLEPGYGVYTDPDLVPPVDDEIVVPITVIYEDGIDVTSQMIYWNLPYASDMDDVGAQGYALVQSYLSSVNYPLYSVTVEEMQAPIDPPVDAIPTTTGTVPFFVLHQIRLHETRDWLTKDEFESWFGSSSSGISYPPSEYRYQHNDESGEKTTDARGKQIRLKDVNVGGKNYTQDEDFAMFSLMTRNFYINPYEDDNTAGKMKRNHYDYTTTDGKKVEKTNWDAYNVAGNTVDRMEFRTILDSKVQFDQDDRYSQGAIYNITLDGMKRATLDGVTMINTDDKPTNKRLDDVRWVFGLKYDSFVSVIAE